MRIALQSAGYKFTSQPSAYMYHSKGIMTKMGFTQIDKSSTPKKGDVVVWPAHGVGNGGGKHGHIAIYDGNNWISDFVQRNYIVNTHYNRVTPALYRDLSEQTVEESQPEQAESSDPQIKVVEDRSVETGHPKTVVESDVPVSKKASIEELRVRAFMRMLREGEGTVGEVGYETLFSGPSFIKDYGKTFDDHPKIHMPFGNTTSTAARAYQVMGYTWDDSIIIKRRNEYNITNFNQLNQDRFCVILLKYKRRDAWPFLLSGKIKESLELRSGSKGYAYEWASLPPGRYGQPNKSMSEALRLYNMYYEQENNGQTDLHIPYGEIIERFIK